MEFGWIVRVLGINPTVNRSRENQSAKSRIERRKGSGVFFGELHGEKRRRFRPKKTPDPLLVPGVIFVVRRQMMCAGQNPGDYSVKVN